MRAGQAWPEVNPEIDGSLAIVGFAEKHYAQEKFTNLEFVLPLKLTLTFQDD